MKAIPITSISTKENLLLINDIKTNDAEGGTTISTWKRFHFLTVLMAALTIAVGLAGKIGGSEKIKSMSFGVRMKNRRLLNFLANEENFIIAASLNNSNSSEFRAKSIMLNQTDIKHIIGLDLNEAWKNTQMTIKDKLYQRFAMITLWLSLSNQNDIDIPAGDECKWRFVTCDNSKRVEKLHLSQQNGWNGTIPMVIGALKSLTFLDLSENEIGGSIPEQMYMLKDLKRLYLNDNNLEGTLSQAVGSLENLVDLYLGKNQLSGTLPKSLKSLTRMRYLSLGENKFEGNFPSNLRLKRLFYLDVSFNEINGTLPSDTFSKYDELRHVYLHSNSFEGTVPESLIGSQIKTIVLNNNRFNGTFPTTDGFVKSRKLVTLLMKNNSFEQRISKQICKMSTFKEGNLVQLEADCDICKCWCCIGMCDNCKKGNGYV